MNNKLVESSAQIRTNGHLKESVQISLQENNYRVNQNGKEQILEVKELLGADLYYFEVPEDNMELYSLARGEALHVVQSNSSSFLFEHEGKKESHTFKEGALDELTINHKLYSIIFKKKD